MKLIHTLLSLLLGIQLLFGQTQQPIPGSKYSLIPPPDFEIATTFSGFQHKTNGASILLNELPVPYSQLNSSFTSKALSERGMTVITDEPATFSLGKGRLLGLRQTANGILYFKQIGIVGDSLKTVLITASYPETEKALENGMRKSVLSLLYNPTQNDNPFDAVSFTIDVSGTDFKFTKYLSGSLIFTTDGVLNQKGSPPKSMLIAGNSISKVAVRDRQAFSVERLKALPGNPSVVIQEISPVEIDHLPGYAILADNTEDESKIYQVILFPNDEDYYILLGMIPKDRGSDITVFKKIYETFKQKK